MCVWGGGGEGGSGESEDGVFHLISFYITQDIASTIKTTLKCKQYNKHYNHSEHKRLD